MKHEIRLSYTLTEREEQSVISDLKDAQLDLDVNKYLRERLRRYLRLIVNEAEIRRYGKPIKKKKKLPEAN